MSKKKIIIALPYGQTIRDVLRSDTYSILKSNTNLEILILASGADDVNFQKEFSANNVKFEVLSPYKQNKLELLLQSFYLSTLAPKSNTIRIYAKFDKKSALSKLVKISAITSKVIGRFNLQKLIGFFMKLANRSRPYKKIFEKFNPDVVIVTRVLRASPDYPVLKEADHKRIPVLALASSWDNFTTKGFFPFGVKKLVVWNDIMKKEAIELFNFPESKILVSGIPRYDKYFNPPKISSKQQFLEALELHPGKKLITYTTGNKTAVLPPGHKISAEVEIVKGISLAIQDGTIPNAQLLVRLHPLADVSDFDLFNEDKCVIVQIPGKVTSFQDRLFSASDDVNLIETLKYSDVVVNVASTITIDAAVFDTPSISVRFDVYGEIPFEHSIKRVYEYEHYRTLRKTGGVDIADSPKELFEKINLALSNSEYLKSERKKIIKQQAQYTDGKAGARVGKAIVNFVENETSSEN